MTAKMPKGAASAASPLIAPPQLEEVLERMRYYVVFYPGGRQYPWRSHHKDIAYASAKASGGVVIPFVPEVDKKTVHRLRQVLDTLPGGFT